jgi:MFS family permease
MNVRWLVMRELLVRASPMIQDLFHGQVSAVAAAGFVGVLSLFNMGGRFVWASCSDFIGRKPTYIIFFAAGSVLYFLLPTPVRNIWTA